MITGFFDYDDGTGEHEITDFIVALNKNKRECSGDYHHSVDQVRMTLRGDLSIIQKLNATDKVIKARLLKDGSAYFTGLIPPTESLSTEGESLSGPIADNIELEILDRTAILEVAITPDDNIVFEGYYVLNPADKAHSIVHQLLYKRGLTDAEIDDSITIAIALLAWSREDGQYKDHLDQLLFNYGYYFDFDNSGKIIFKKWIATSISPSGALEDYIKGTLKIDKRDLPAEGILVEWYSLKEKADVLLYMADLPFGDDNLRSGWPIQAGFLYPEEANIKTTFQEYQDSGAASVIINKTAQKDADFTQIILTKNHSMDEGFEDGIVREITVFQNKRAQIAYRNSDPSDPKLIFFSNVRGDVIYKGAKNETKAINVTGTKKINTVVAESIHDEFSASAFAQGLANSLRNSRWQYTFDSDYELPTGTDWTLTEESTDTDCVVRLIERGENPDDGTYNYIAIRIAELDEVDEETTSTVLPEAPESNNSNPTQQLQNVPTYYELDVAGYSNAQATNVPTVPVFVAQGVFKGVTLLIARQTNLSNFLRYEIQVSEDEEDWYAVGLTDGWHGALDAVTESPLDYFVHAGILPSGTEEAPVGRTLFYRVRRVTKALAYSAWSSSISETTSIIDTADLAENSITANKLVVGLISALIAQISESLVVSSDYGWQAGNYVSPVRGNKRSFVRQDEMALQEYDGSTWIYKVLMGWITDRYGIKAENLQAIDRYIRIGKTLHIDQDENTVKMLSSYSNTDWSAPETLSSIYGIPHTMENGQIVFVLYNSTVDSFAIRIKELDGSITASELVPGSDTILGTGLYTACSDPDGNLFFSYQDSSTLYFRLLSRTIGGVWTDFGIIDSGGYGYSITEIVSIKYTNAQNVGKILYVFNNNAAGTNSIRMMIYNMNSHGITARAVQPTTRTIPYHAIHLIRTDDGVIRVLYAIDMVTEYHTFDYDQEEFDAYTLIPGNLRYPVMVPIGKKILVCAYSSATSTYRTVILSFSPTLSLEYSTLPERFYALFRDQDGVVYGWDALTAPVEQRILSPYEKVVSRVEIGDMVTSARTTKRHCLLCDGSAISRTVYSELFLAIGTSFGAGDGSTTFNIPDMRGVSPGGAGTSAGYIQNETITFAAKHNDQLQGHRFTLNNSSSGYVGGQIAINVGNTQPSVYFYPGGGGNGTVFADKMFTNGTDGDPRKGPTTRGKVVGLNFFIIYE